MAANGDGGHSYHPQHVAKGVSKSDIKNTAISRPDACVTCDQKSLAVARDFSEALGPSKPLRAVAGMQPGRAGMLAAGDAGERNVEQAAARILAVSLTQPKENKLLLTE